MNGFCIEGNERLSDEERARRNKKLEGMRKAAEEYWEKQAKEAREKEEKRVEKKAKKLNITSEEVIKIEKEKAEERKLNAKIKRYEKDIEELKEILAYKEKWLAENKK